MRVVKTAVAVAYVGGVTTFAAIAFSDRNGTFAWSRQGVAMLLTLPALLPALPLIYLAGAAIWNLTNADNGGPMWPVTVWYAALFGAVAVLNLWTSHRLYSWWRSHR
jgi:hypothetical protein